MARIASAFGVYGDLEEVCLRMHSPAAVYLTRLQLMGNARGVLAGAESGGDRMHLDG